MASDDTYSNGKHTERSTDEEPATQRGDLPAIPDRYAALTLARDETYIYDQRDPNAWIQSDTVRPLDQAA